MILLRHLGRWLQRYQKYGHCEEDKIQTLIYDKACCHVQGDCEWVSCSDTVAVRLMDGEALRPITSLTDTDESIIGLISSSNERAVLPSPWITVNTTILLFKVC